MLFPFKRACTVLHLCARKRAGWALSTHTQRTLFCSYIFHFRPDVSQFSDLFPPRTVLPVTFLMISLFFYSFPTLCTLSVLQLYLSLLLLLLSRERAPSNDHIWIKYHADFVLDKCCTCAWLAVCVGFTLVLLLLLASGSVVLRMACDLLRCDYPFGVSIVGSRHMW